VLIDQRRPKEHTMPTALITGASRGLGFALARELGARGWNLLVTARDGDALRSAVTQLETDAHLTTVDGDVTDPAHRARLADIIRSTGRLELLVNNASELGPSPRPVLLDLPDRALERVFAVNVAAPMALIRALAAPLRSTDGTIVNITSDVAVEPSAGWGGYGASKAALEHLTAVLAAEEPGLAVYAFDPGDLRTAMHQAAFPDEDISDRPDPATAVPAILRLLASRPPSGRYGAADLLVDAGGLA
jgi:NAD(P)-dependent dehydrogenase (short-subunit alcohol dehydrogenase family)